MTLFRVLAGLLAVGSTTIALSAQSFSPADMTDWKTYRNEAMGFEVMHPNTWLIRLSTGTMESVTVDKPRHSGEPTASVTLMIQHNINPKGLSISEWKTEMMKMHKTTTAQFPTTDIVVGGKPGFRSERVNTPKTFSTTYILFNKTDILTVLADYPTSDSQLEKITEATVTTIKYTH